MARRIVSQAVSSMFFLVILWGEHGPIFPMSRLRQLECRWPDNGEMVGQWSHWDVRSWGLVFDTKQACSHPAPHAASPAASSCTSFQAVCILEICWVGLRREITLPHVFICKRRWMNSVSSDSFWLCSWSLRDFRGGGRVTHTLG